MPALGLVEKYDLVEDIQRACEIEVRRADNADDLGLWENFPQTLKAWNGSDEITELVRPGDQDVPHFAELVGTPSLVDGARQSRDLLFQRSRSARREVDHAVGVGVVGFGERWLHHKPLGQDLIGLVSNLGREVQPIVTFGKDGEIGPDVEAVFMNTILLRLVFHQVGPFGRPSMDQQAIDVSLHLDDARLGDHDPADRLYAAHHGLVAPVGDLPHTDLAQGYGLLAISEQLFGRSRHQFGRHAAVEGRQLHLVRAAVRLQVLQAQDTVEGPGLAPLAG